MVMNIYTVRKGKVLPNHQKHHKMRVSGQDAHKL